MRYLTTNKRPVLSLCIFLSAIACGENSTESIPTPKPEYEDATTLQDLGFRDSDIDPRDAEQSDGRLDAQDQSLEDAGVDASTDINDAANDDAATSMDATGQDTGFEFDAGEADAQTITDSGDTDAGPQDAGSPSDSGVQVDSGPSNYERTIVGSGAPLASMGTNGRLEYRRYANQGQQNITNILPDFSYAGYQRGGIAIPDINVEETLNPTSGDARARIQDAIDRVSQRTPDSDGYRGAILLTQGNYEVSDTIQIRASGVVLRGEGQGGSGTILTATRQAQHNLLEIRGTGSGFGEVSGTRVRITTATVSVGTNNFDVETGHSFVVGDVVVVLRTPNQHWIDTLEMGRYGWTSASYTIGHERTVVQVTGSRIWIDIPIVDTIEAGYGGGSVYKANITGRIENSGVEDIRLVSEYTGNEDEDHAWVGVLLARANNSWVRRVTVEHFGYAAVQISSESNFNTVEDTAMLDPISIITGGRRYPFVINDGVGNLFQRCYSREGRHNFVTGSRVTGPNVWLDCLAVQSNSDDGPHHRWSTGLLFDNTSGGSLDVQNRRSSGTGHGWAGAQTLFWNAIATSIICDSPAGAMNWTIGSSGTRRQGTWPPAEPNCWTESHGTAITPRSLYLQQLADRLGSRAVEAVTLPAQRVGSITNYLDNWAGESRLDELLRPDPMCARGILSGRACCSNSCGTCGGTGCSQRPGGASQCCSGSITSAGRSCADFPPPCLTP